MLNPPIAWVLTIAEVIFGCLLVSWEYPTLGGIVIGLAVGSFISRANMPWHIAWALRRDQQK